MYNQLISNLNSEQLVWGLEWKSKTMIFITNKAEMFWGIKNFFLMEKKLVTSHLMVANI